MNLLHIIEVCIVREGNCRGCIVATPTCEHAKKILRCDKPMDYYPMIYKECEEYHGRGNDGESD